MSWNVKDYEDKTKMAEKLIDVANRRVQKRKENEARHSSGHICRRFFQYEQWAKATVQRPTIRPVQSLRAAGILSAIGLWERRACDRLIYSCRSAIRGSMPAARRAGR